MKAEWIGEIAINTNRMNMPNGVVIVFETKTSRGLTSVFVPDINYNEELGEWETLENVPKPFHIYPYKHNKQKEVNNNGK